MCSPSAPYQLIGIPPASGFFTSGSWPPAPLRGIWSPWLCGCHNLNGKCTANRRLLCFRHVVPGKDFDYPGLKKKEPSIHDDVPIDYFVRRSYWFGHVPERPVGNQQYLRRYPLAV